MCPKTLYWYAGGDTEEFCLYNIGQVIQMQHIWLGRITYEKRHHLKWQQAVIPWPGHLCLPCRKAARRQRRHLYRPYQWQPRGFSNNICWCTVVGDWREDRRAGQTGRWVSLSTERKTPSLRYQPAVAVSAQGAVTSHPHFLGAATFC